MKSCLTEQEFMAVRHDRKSLKDMVRKVHRLINPQLDEQIEKLKTERKERGEQWKLKNPQQKLNLTLLISLCDSDQSNATENSSR
jgi:hypothetical protein